MEQVKESARRHVVLVRVLLGIAVIVGLFAMFAVWVNRQVFNTDNWEKTSSDLLANKNIQNALGAYMVNELFSNVDVAAELRTLLPPQADAVAGPAAAGLQQLAGQAAPKLLASPPVQDAWRSANRAAQKQFVTIVNGGGPAVSTSGGEVVLNLRVLVNQLAGQLGVQSQVNAARQKLQGSAGATARNTVQQKLGVTLPSSTGKLVIMRSNDLKTVQDVAKGIRHLAVILTALALGLFALAVYLAVGWRRVALRSVGWCFVFLGLLVLLARRVVGNRVVDSLAASPSVKPAAHSAWTIGTQLLYTIAIAMFAYGVLLVLAAWLAGPTRSAVAVRQALAPSMRDRVGVVYGTVGVIFLLVLLWGPTPATRKPLGIILFAALIVLGVELLRRQAAREFPDARHGETMERLRERWARSRGKAEAEPSGVAAGGSAAARFDELDKLASLHDRGVLSDEEFQAQKVLVLGGS